MSNYLVDELVNLSKNERRLAAGEFLFRARDSVKSLFLVTHGVVQLTRVLRRGFQLTLQRAGPGAILAEASLFSDCYHCDARATEQSTLRVIPLQRLFLSLKNDAEFASTLMSHFAHEIQQARAKVETLSLKTVAERVDAWITLNKGSLPPKGHWHEVATEIGVSAEALYRELARRRRGTDIKREISKGGKKPAAAASA